MTSVDRVPETRTMDGDELSADDAWRAVRRHGGWRLVRDSFVRMRDADGFAYSKAVGFEISLAIIPLIVALVGLGRLLGGEAGRVVDLTVRGVTPGSTDALISTTAGGSGLLAFAGGLVGCVFALTSAMAEIERGANRVYGSDEDRDTVPRYVRSVLMALAAGVPSLLGWLFMVGGAAVGDAVRDVYAVGPAAERLWDIGRWPGGLLLAVLGFAIVFEKAPRRRQPSWSWLAFGGVVTVALWTVFTTGLALYVQVSDAFDETYGQLTGVIALLIWSYLSSVALFLGLAFAAQLEAVHGRGRRRGVPFGRR